MVNKRKSIAIIPVCGELKNVNKKDKDK